MKFNIRILSRNDLRRSGRTLWLLRHLQCVWTVRFSAPARGSGLGSLAALNPGLFGALDLRDSRIVNHDLHHAVAQGFHFLAHQRKPFGNIVVHRLARFLELEALPWPSNGMTSS